MCSTCVLVKRKENNNVEKRDGNGVHLESEGGLTSRDKSNEKTKLQ